MSLRMITWKYDCWENNNRKTESKPLSCAIFPRMCCFAYTAQWNWFQTSALLYYLHIYFNHDLQQRQVAKAVNKIVGLKAFNTVISQFTTTDWDVSTTEQIENMISYDSANSLTQWQIETKIQAENLIPSQSPLFACCTRPKF